MFKVYTQENCPKCTELKGFLKANNYEYEEVDVNTDSKARAKMLLNDVETTPAVEFNDEMFSGEPTDIFKKITGISL